MPFGVHMRPCMAETTGFTAWCGNRIDDCRACLSDAEQQHELRMECFHAKIHRELEVID